MVGYLAFILALIGLILIGQKNRTGFLFFVISCSLWTIVGISTAVYGLVLQNLIFIVLNLYYYITWRS